MNLATQQPSLASDVFVAPSAAVIGDVTLGQKASVWYGCVLKGKCIQVITNMPGSPGNPICWPSAVGDEGTITVGNNTNLQDGTVVRSATSNLGNQILDTKIGNNVTIGHNTTLRSCSIADASLVGMDATILEGVKVSAPCWYSDMAASADCHMPKLWELLSCSCVVTTVYEHQIVTLQLL